MWGPGDSEHKRDTDHPMERFPFYRGETKAESKRPSPCASKLYYGTSVGSRQFNPSHQINSGPTGNASFSSQAEGSSPCIWLKTLPLKTQLIMLTQSSRSAGTFWRNNALEFKGEDRKGENRCVQWLETVRPRVRAAFSPPPPQRSSLFSFGFL